MAANKKSKILPFLSFLIYLVLLGYFLFFAEGMGRHNSEAEYRYNLVLFQEIKRFIYHVDVLGIKAVMINVVGNIIVFMPFGYFVPRLARRTVGVWTTVLFSLEFSVLVEVMQLLSKKGSFDVDDLLLNTIGGLIGYVVYYVIHRWRLKKHNK